VRVKKICPFWVALSLSLVAGCTAFRVAPRPEIPQDQPLETPPASFISLPIRISYPGLIELTQLETKFPLEEDRNDSWREVPTEGSGNGIKYKWSREPFRASGRDSTLTLSTVVVFQAKYAKRVKQPWPFTNSTWLPLGSCGYDGTMPRVRLRFSTSLSLLNNWKLTSKSEATAEFLEPCVVSIIGFDVTRRLKELFEENLSQAAREFDKRVGESNQLEQRARMAWDQLKAPIGVGEEKKLKLFIRPKAISIAKLVFADSAITFGLNLEAHPEMSAETVDTGLVQSLPILRSDSSSGKFLVTIRITLHDSAASEMLKSKLIGREFKFPSGQRVVVRDAEVFGNASKLVLRIRFAGQFDGDLYFAGKPQFDSASQRIRIPDFEYDLKTRDWFVAAEEWLVHKEFLGTLKSFAVWDLRNEMETARGRLADALNKEIGNGLRLRGRVDQPRVVGFQREAAGVSAVVILSGSASVESK